MPIDPRRRDDIVAAVAAHDSANPNARLLAAMFPLRTCVSGARRPSPKKASTGRTSPACSKSPLVTGRVLIQEAGSGVVPDTYRLHLPPVRP